VRNTVFAIIAVLLGLLVPLGVAEIALRFLPVSEGLRAAPVNEADPVFHFSPDRELTWSQGWRFNLVNRVRINHAGYANNQIYAIDDPRPLLAVVGDSYVEAAMIPYAETLQGRLAAVAAPDMRVYSFGASGAPLSQYLVWAREARAKWKAQALVVVVVGNDFDESLAVYKAAPGFHHYVEAGDGSLQLKRFDYSPSLVRLAIQRSALARYLILNLQVQEHLPRLKDWAFSRERPTPDDHALGNTSADTSPERLDKSKAAVRAFLNDIGSFAGWRTDQVLFVIDGVRYPARASGLAASYFGQMRSYFISQAQSAGFEVIDMDDHFFARFKAGPVQFEFAADGHWNALAHGVAADAAAKSAVFAHWRRSGGL
jgi:hypothetical protein